MGLTTRSDKIQRLCFQKLRHGAITSSHNYDEIAVAKNVTFTYKGQYTLFPLVLYFPNRTSGDMGVGRIYVPHKVLNGGERLQFVSRFIFSGFVEGEGGYQGSSAEVVDAADNSGNTILYINIEIPEDEDFGGIGTSISFNYTWNAAITNVEFHEMP